MNRKNLQVVERLLRTYRQMRKTFMGNLHHTLKYKASQITRGTVNVLANRHL